MQLYRNGVPDSVRVYNTPGKFFNSVNGDLGLFAQDAWTIKRLTLNVGARFDRLATQVDGTHSGGRVGSRRSNACSRRSRCRCGPPSRHAWASPTTSSAMRRRRSRAAGASSSRRGAPASRSSTTRSRSETRPRTWSDLNGDDIAQDNEIGPAADVNFGRVTALTRSPDPDIERAYNLSSSLGVEHQLLPGLGGDVHVVPPRMAEPPSHRQRPGDLCRLHTGRYREPARWHGDHRLQPECGQTRSGAAGGPQCDRHVERAATATTRSSLA